MAKTRGGGIDDSGRSLLGWDYFVCYIYMLVVLVLEILKIDR